MIETACVTVFAGERSLGWVKEECGDYAKLQICAGVRRRDGDGEFLWRVKMTGGGREKGRRKTIAGARLRRCGRLLQFHHHLLGLYM